MLRAEGIRLVESRPKSLRVLAIQPLERDRIVEVGRDVALLAQVSNLPPGQPGLKRRRRRTDARATCIRPRGSDVALSTMENPRTGRELGRDDTRLHRRPSTSADRLGDGVESGPGAPADKTNRRNVSCNRDLPR